MTLRHPVSRQIQVECWISQISPRADSIQSGGVMSHCYTHYFISVSICVSSVFDLWAWHDEREIPADDCKCHSRADGICSRWVMSHSSCIIVMSHSSFIIVTSHSSSMVVMSHSRFMVVMSLSSFTVVMSHACTRHFVLWNNCSRRR